MADKKIVDLAKRVTVYATATHKFAKEDTELSMSPNVAEYLENKGWVTKTQSAKKEKGGQK